MNNVDFSQLEPARQQSQQASQSYVDYASKGATLADELRKALGERFGQSNVAQNTAQARADFMTALPQGRADVANLVSSGTILSPTQQQAILSGKRASALVPLMGANITQEAAFGTMEDLINAGVNAYGAQTSQKKGMAELAQQNYTQLLNELVTRAEQQRLEERFPLEMQLLKAQISDTLRGSTADQQQNTLNNLRSDVQSGATLSDVMKKYSTEIDPESILQLYNINSPYGPAEESSSQLNELFGIAPSKNQLEEESTQRKLLMTDSLIKGMENDLKNISQGKLGGTLEKVQSFFGVDPSLKNLEQKKKLLIGQLNEIMQLGKLTDEDQRLILETMPVETDTAQETSDKLNTLKSMLNKYYNRDEAEIVNLDAYNSLQLDY